MAEYAIIKTGGKQYRVQPGDIIDVELVQGADADGNIEFKEVLALCGNAGMKIGSPVVPSAAVKGEVVDIVRGPKVIAYKYKRRKNYRRKVGHRQDYMRVKITELTL